MIKEHTGRMRDKEKDMRTASFMYSWRNMKVVAQERAARVEYDL